MTGINDVVIVSDMEINDYVTSLGDLKPESKPALVLNQLLLLNDTLFRRVMSSLITGVVTIDLLGELPEINETTIRTFFDEFYNSDELLRLQLLNENFEINGWQNYFYSRAVNVQDYLFSKLRSSDDWYIDYTPLRNKFPLSANQVILDTYNVSINHSSNDSIKTEIETLKDQLVPLVENFESSIHSVYTTILARNIFRKRVSNVDIFANNLVLGFIVRQLYRTSLISTGLVSIIKNTIIRHYPNFLDDENLGYISFNENIYNTFSFESLTQSINTTFDTVYNNLYLNKVLIPQYYNEIITLPDYFVELDDNVLIFELLNSYFEAINTLVVNTRNLCIIEMNRVLQDD